MTVWFGETKQVPFRVQGTNLASQEPIDPSASELEAGFVLASGGDNPPESWFAATWDANTNENIYWGQVLVGPSGVFDLPRGEWAVWAKFAIGAETIIQPVLDSLTVR